MSVIPLSTAALQMSSNCDTSSVFSRSGFTSSLHLKGGGAKTKRNKKVEKLHLLFTQTFSVWMQMNIIKWAKHSKFRLDDLKTVESETQIFTNRLIDPLMTPLYQPPFSLV